jgi:hypothetical protein
MSKSVEKKSQLGLKIFVSIFAVDFVFQKERTLQPIQDAFVAALENQGINFYNSSEYIGYEEIFKKIEESNLFVALIDDGWTSSTWKMRELFYSCGATAENDGKFIQKAIKTLVFSSTSNPNIHSLAQNGFIEYFDGTLEGMIEKIRKS